MSELGSRSISHERCSSDERRPVDGVYGSNTCDVVVDA